ncbi:MAG: tRNA (adenosine(37)-N6)-dimethylallyltransferase MiaA [Parcubacteria group bacterium]|nr:tRNA (adenosine(37)-N6)-dimethylallyltransferase MiaA [Parcubacteria group bacterium]
MFGVTEKNCAKIIVIVGPTASGKSELAVKIAKKFNGEIISADSRQVYKYLDIGSAKVEGRWKNNRFIYKKIVHHCIDFVNPKKVYTVAEYKKCAGKAIKDITSRGKIPILVGGTGFYIDSVIYDLPLPEVPPDENLRKRLNRLSPAELFEQLTELDRRRAANIDRFNKRRLIRALEIVLKTGKPVSANVTVGSRSWVNCNILTIGLRMPPRQLKKRIENRLDGRLKGGLIEEVKNLHENPPAGGGLSWKRLDDFGLEYRYVSRYLRGIISYEEMRRKILAESWHYAKRQMTWWKRNKDIIWFNPCLPAGRPSLLTDSRLYGTIETFINK